MYLLYKTDAQHSYASRDLLAICTTIENIMIAIKQQVKKEGEKLSNDDVYNLLNIKQTQGYNGSGEFDYEKVSINTLL